MSDAIAASLAKALGLPPRPGTYIGGDDRFRPIVEAARALMGPGADFAYNSFQILLEKLSAIEPLFQVPCAKETAVLEELFNEAVDTVSYGRMIQFYATRSLSRLNFGSIPLPSPSIDVGCGDGLTPKLVFRDRMLDVGSDLFVHDLIEARRLRAPFKRLEATDIQNLAYADNQFATITCMNTLYHAPDQVKALEEMGRVLAPGGTLYFDVICPGFADLIPLRRMLQAGGFTVAAEEVRKAFIKPQAELPISALLPGFDVEIIPTMSMELFNIAYYFYALDQTLPYTPPTTDRKDQTLRFLRTVVAPLLAQDRQLAAKGGAYLFVKATKHGSLQATEPPAHRCPKCFEPLPGLSCAPCAVTYPAIKGIPLLAKQYIEPFAELSSKRKA